MDAKIRELIESVGNFFSSSDNIPWAVSERLLKPTKGSSDEAKAECLMSLSWALVHSRQPEDVQRGIAMLQSCGSDTPLQMRERLYLLAVGYYPSDNFITSRQLVERCLEIPPDWRQALTLEKSIEDKITKAFQHLEITKIAATAVGLLVGGIAAFARNA